MIKMEIRINDAQYPIVIITTIEKLNQVLDIIAPVYPENKSRAIINHYLKENER